MSDIDRAERERDLAEAINLHGAVHVARECARTGARMLYTSTDAVFDGSQGIYYEHDPPTPLNWYGQTKARAEAAIAELLPSAAIVRLSLVLGYGAQSGGNSYLEKVTGNLQAGNQIISPTYEFRNPIDVSTLCEFFAELHAQSRGIPAFFTSAPATKCRAMTWHWPSPSDWAPIPQLIVAQTAPVPGRAPRGLDDFLVTDRLRQVCRTAVPTCQQVIERALHGVA